MIPLAHHSSAKLRDADRASVVALPIPATDAGLVHALRAGHRAAAAALFDRYSDHVERVLIRVLGPDQELDDLLQDVFVAALESVGRLEDPGALKAWLAKIAVFLARGRIRRRTRWRFIRPLPLEELVDKQVEWPRTELSAALRETYAVLDQLPTDERIAFALRFVQGMDLTEVAAACSVSLATIKRRLRRARTRFVQLASERPTLAEWIAGGTRWNP
jgi:RNA polymerase sigma-70 factor (ECF subfamily)